MISITYLNLDRDTDRRRHFEKNVDAPGVTIERLSAFTPNTMPANIACRFRADIKLLPGEIGCFASHIAAWEKISIMPSGLHIVCEDDVLFNGNIRDLKEIFSLMDARLPFVQLHGVLKSSAVRVNVYKDLRLVRPLFSVMSCAAYALRPETARALLCASFELGLPVDGFLRKFGRINLDMLFINPAPFHIVVFPTTTSPEGQRGKRSKPNFRGSGFSFFGEIKFIRRFGIFGFLKLFIAYLIMKALRLKTDPLGRFEVSP